MPNEYVQFLSVDEVLAIQERLIDRFGGVHGIRDKGSLESALFRPQTGYYDDLPAMAAAMFESLLVNHAFVDGNKRVAFFATDTFLRLNGWRIVVEADAGYAFITGLLRGTGDRYEAVRAWLESSIERL